MSADASTDTAGTKKLKVLGVSGGIGSGKSTACKLLVSDLDCVAHIGTYVIMLTRPLRHRESTVTPARV